MGFTVDLTSEFLKVGLSDATIRALQAVVSGQPVLKEVLGYLLKTAELPTIMVRDITSASVEAVPSTPEAVHMLNVIVSTRYPGGQRTYELPLETEQAKNLAQSIGELIQKKF